MPKKTGIDKNMYYKSSSLITNTLTLLVALVHPSIAIIPGYFLDINIGLDS